MGGRNLTEKERCEQHQDLSDHNQFGVRQGMDSGAISVPCNDCIRTERGNLNREIEVTNQRLRQLKARIGKLQNWLKEEQQSTAHINTLQTLTLLRRNGHG